MPLRSASGSPISARRIATSGVRRWTNNSLAPRRSSRRRSRRLNAGQRSRLAVDFNEAKAASERATAILRPLETSLNTAVEALNSVQRQTQGVDADSGLRGFRRPDAGDVEGLARQSRCRPLGRLAEQRLAQARDRLVAGAEDAEPSGGRRCASNTRGSASTTPDPDPRPGAEGGARRLGATARRRDQGRGRSLRPRLPGR